MVAFAGHTAALEMSQLPSVHMGSIYTSRLCKQTLSCVVYQDLAVGTEGRQIFLLETC